jgi:hypothetical protein
MNPGSNRMASNGSRDPVTIPTEHKTPSPVKMVPVQPPVEMRRQCPHGGGTEWQTGKGTIPSTREHIMICRCCGLRWALDQATQRIRLLG